MCWGVGELGRRCDFGYCRGIKVEAVRVLFEGQSDRAKQDPGEILDQHKQGKYEWLIGLFDIVFKTMKTLEQWRWSTIVSLYKNKGDIQNGNNYMDIKLLSHSVNLKISSC